MHIPNRNSFLTHVLRDSLGWPLSLWLRSIVRYHSLPLDSSKKWDRLKIQLKRLEIARISRQIRELEEELRVHNECRENTIRRKVRCAVDLANTPSIYVVDGEEARFVWDVHRSS